MPKWYGAGAKGRIQTGHGGARGGGEVGGVTALEKAWIFHNVSGQSEVLKRLLARMVGDLL